MRCATVPLSLVLAACQPSGGEGAAREAQSQQAGAHPQAPALPASAEISAPTLALEVDGLRLVAENGPSRLLAFGTAREQAERAIDALLEMPPERTRIEECGAGPMEFTGYGPLQLNFLDGAFVGWFVSGAGAATRDGIGIGSTREQAAAARTLTMVPGSTLGEEFMLGRLDEESIGGFLDGDGEQAKVAQLFAGTNCFFR